MIRKKIQQIQGLHGAQCYKWVLQVALPMTRPTKHHKTGVYQVRKSVPKSLRNIVGKGELVRSLGTKNPVEAKRLALVTIAEFDQVIEQARRGERPIWMLPQGTTGQAGAGEPDHAGSTPMEMRAAAPPSSLRAAAQAIEPLAAAALLDAWSAERGPSPRTRQRYGTIFRTVARVLGFDDVRRITPADVVKFKRHRLEVEKLDVGTVEDDIRGAGGVCKWGTTNHLLPANPFAGLAPKAMRKLAVRHGYDDDDAKRLLLAARAETGWLRWAPWLLCFTGARIGELAELRRGDVREDGGVQILDIRPHEMRPGKNETMQRMIPLHPALIAEGFLKYVEALPPKPAGPLFPSITPDPHGKRDTPAQTILGRWVRTKVKIIDPKKAPAHSWRHRMEDELRRVRALPEVQDAITGRHNPRNAGAGYGRGFRGMPEEVLKELSRVPSPLDDRAAGPASDQVSDRHASLRDIPPQEAPEIVREVESALEAWFAAEAKRSYAAFASSSSPEGREMTRGDALSSINILADEFQSGDISAGRGAILEISERLGRALPPNHQVTDAIAAWAMEALAVIHEARVTWADGNRLFRPSMPTWRGMRTRLAKAGS
ncbi:DUF6538 domain-containing protein [Falsiroseomonas sp. HC035]|uniref:DUF6538 domain-containing protein n=1 Tax=Falsiroseomonas sp. HC035 TaxID=3390999 RepID=UPI003D310B8B